MTVENEEGTLIRPSMVIHHHILRAWIYSKTCAVRSRHLLDAMKRCKVRLQDISAGDSVLIAGLGNRNLTAML